MDKIAIIGYGKMGKMLEEHASLHNFEVCSIIDPILGNSITEAALNGAKIAIEFTTPKTALNNFNALFDLGISVVTGTTGWYDQLEAVKQKANEKRLGFFHASNFSIGMNIVFEINERLASIMEMHNNYCASINENHHTNKLDKPSGTAISVAQGIIENNKNYSSWIVDSEPPPLHTLPIHTKREDDVIGIHSIAYKSTVDQIKLEHQAFSRDGFAQGALVAARFLIGKQGVYTMKHLLTR